MNTTKKSTAGRKLLHNSVIKVDSFTEPPRENKSLHYISYFTIVSLYLIIK